MSDNVPYAHSPVYSTPPVSLALLITSSAAYSITACKKNGQYLASESHQAFDQASSSYYSAWSPQATPDSSTDVPHIYYPASSSSSSSSRQPHHPNPPPLSPFLASTSQLLSSSLAQAAGLNLPSVPPAGPGPHPHTRRSPPLHSPYPPPHSPSAQSPLTQSQAQASVQGASPLPRIYQCEECGRAFARNHDLTRHRKSHLGIKPHRCKYCNRGFTRGDALRRHASNTGCGMDEQTGLPLLPPQARTPPPDFEIGGRRSLSNPDIHGAVVDGDGMPSYYAHQASASAPPDLCALSYPSDAAAGHHAHTEHGAIPIPATYIPHPYYYPHEYDSISPEGSPPLH